MAKFKFKATTSVKGYFSAKVKGAITDADVGKAVKLSTDTADTYELCANGDEIEAFIAAVDPATADGLAFCTLNNGACGGRKRCEAEGAMNVGDLVEAGAQAAAGTAETNGLPLVSTRTVAAYTDVPTYKWRVVSGTTTDGSISDGDTAVIVERVA